MKTKDLNSQLYESPAVQVFKVTPSECIAGSPAAEVQSSNIDVWEDGNNEWFN